MTSVNEFLVLGMDLVNELMANSASSADEKIEYFVLREEEGVMKYIHGLAKQVTLHYKGDVGFRCTLSTGYDTDAASSQCSK